MKDSNRKETLVNKASGKQSSSLEHICRSFLFPTNIIGILLTQGEKSQSTLVSARTDCSDDTSISKKRDKLLLLTVLSPPYPTICHG